MAEIEKLRKENELLKRYIKEMSEYCELDVNPEMIIAGLRFSFTYFKPTALLATSATQDTSATECNT